jgi:MinD-like ATPase involved in chromosome partitioning or flagellar assembly
VTALSVGITTARFATCKRGLAVNVAAIRARDVTGGRVCVVDADPRSLDVTTRFAVGGPYLEDFADQVVDADDLASVHQPPLWVVPSADAGIGHAYEGAPRALPRLRREFDLVICDVLGGPSGPARVLGRLEQLDWLLLAVTPDVEPVATAVRFLEQSTTRSTGATSHRRCGSASSRPATKAPPI